MAIGADEAFFKNTWVAIFFLQNFPCIYFYRPKENERRKKKETERMRFLKASKRDLRDKCDVQVKKGKWTLLAEKLGIDRFRNETTRN